MSKLFSGDICPHCKVDVRTNGFYNEKDKSFTCCENPPRSCKDEELHMVYGLKDCIGCPEWCINSGADYGYDENGKICRHCGDVFEAEIYLRGQNISRDKPNFCSHCGLKREFTIAGRGEHLCEMCAEALASYENTKRRWEEARLKSWKIQCADIVASNYKRYQEWKGEQSK